MSIEHEHTDVTVRSGVPGWVAIALVALALLAGGGLLYAWQTSNSIATTRQAMTTDMTTLKQGVGQDMSVLKDRLTQAETTNSGLQSDLTVVTKRLRITQAQLKTAREESAQLRDEANQKLTALDASVDSVRGEVATKASSDDLKTTNGQVTEVRTDLNTTKNDLSMARSELGTLIARNHEEVEELRRLGERDYVEFTLAGKNKPQKVGNITVELRGVNDKRNRYNVAVTVDDKKVERKDRAINEPIFFYPRGTKMAEEIVVNKIGKNEVSGYISIPKASQTATSSSGSPGEQK
jgi:chromosome segregation ATPase